MQTLESTSHRSGSVTESICFLGHFFPYPGRKTDAEKKTGNPASTNHYLWA
jgi:hypothetical protein